MKCNSGITRSPRVEAAHLLLQLLHLNLWVGPEVNHGAA